MTKFEEVKSKNTEKELKEDHKLSDGLHHKHGEQKSEKG